MLIYQSYNLWFCNYRSFQ